MSWPKLSETLEHPITGTDGYQCMSCGRGSECEVGDDLTAWLEHDDADRPTAVAIVLCKRCTRIIEPHPRLYRQIARWEPFPGAMPVCTGCIHLRTPRGASPCGHPDLRANGGPGLSLRFPRPTVAFICARPRKNSGPVTVYHGPVTCDRRTVMQVLP